MNLLLLRISYALLLFVGISGLFSLAPPDVHIVSSIIFAVILYAPLVLMLPAVISGNKRQATWLCFILLSISAVMPSSYWIRRQSAPWPLPRRH